MFEERRDAAEADEDGGRGDEKYEINSKAGTSEDRERMPCGEAQGAVLKVATMSQHTIQKDVLDVLRTVIKKK